MEKNKSLAENHIDVSVKLVYNSLSVAKWLFFGSITRFWLCPTYATNESQHLEGGKFMSEVKVKENESLDSALRRFKRSCAKDGIMGEVRKREHYDKPSVKRKKKSEAARKRKFK